jgi:hypothetical protein
MPAPDSPRTAALAELATIPGRRADLDARERWAIDAARAAGASWSEVAAALGLRSRQAAEQRRSRLGRQRDIDSPAIAELRRAALAAVDAILATPAPPATDLARRTLAVAVADASAGTLIDLVRLALGDLASHPSDGPEDRRVVAARRRLAATLDTALR